MLLRTKGGLRAGPRPRHGPRHPHRSRLDRRRSRDRPPPRHVCERGGRPSSSPGGRQLHLGVYDLTPAQHERIARLRFDAEALLRVPRRREDPGLPQPPLLRPHRPPRACRFPDRARPAASRRDPQREHARRAQRIGAPARARRWPGAGRGQRQPHPGPRGASVHDRGRGPRQGRVSRGLAPRPHRSLWPLRHLRAADRRGHAYLRRRLRGRAPERRSRARGSPPAPGPPGTRPLAAPHPLLHRRHPRPRAALRLSVVPASGPTTGRESRRAAGPPRSWAGRRYGPRPEP